MANANYPKFLEALLSGSSSANLSTGTVKAALVDLNDYTYDPAHEFLSSVQSAIVGTPVTLANKSFTNGAFNSDDMVWSSVTGDEVEAIVLFIDTGTPSTSRLVLYLDSGQTGMPITPNGGDLNYTVAAAGWFSL